MGVLTTLLKLLKPGENDYYNQQTEQADNWDKVDNYAVLTNTDKNGVWGGEFGGYIQDPIPKELNKRYIDNINGKAFICIKAGDSSVVSNTIEYFTPCNVVDNLDKLQNLHEIKRIYKSEFTHQTLIKHSNGVLEYFGCVELLNGKGALGAINFEVPFSHSIDRMTICLTSYQNAGVSGVARYTSNSNNSQLFVWDNGGANGTVAISYIVKGWWR